MNEVELEIEVLMNEVEFNHYKKFMENNEKDLNFSGWCDYKKCKDLFEKFGNPENFHESLKKLFKYETKDTHYFVIIENGNFVGVLQAGMRKIKSGLFAKKLAHIYEIGTSKESKGKSIILFNEFIKKYGNHFWLKCLDENAESFWKHISQKYNYDVKIIGKTSWGTKILEFNK